MYKKALNFSNVSDIGNLMYISLEIISPPIKDEEITPEIRKLARQIKKQGRNYSPVILKEAGEDLYDLAADRETLIAAKVAGQEKVWGIIAPFDYTGDEDALKRQAISRSTSTKSDKGSTVPRLEKAGLAVDRLPRSEQDEIARLKAEIVKLKSDLENTKTTGTSSKPSKKVISPTRTTGLAGKKDKCKKGYPCGRSCIAKNRNCRKQLSNQSNTLAKWLTSNG